MAVVPSQRAGAGCGFPLGGGHAPADFVLGLRPLPTYLIARSAGSYTARIRELSKARASRRCQPRRLGRCAFACGKDSPALLFKHPCELSLYREPLVADIPTPRGYPELTPQGLTSSHASLSAPPPGTQGPSRHRQMNPGKWPIPSDTSAGCDTTGQVLQSEPTKHA